MSVSSGALANDESTDGPGHGPLAWQEIELVAGKQPAEPSAMAAALAAWLESYLIETPEALDEELPEAVGRSLASSSIARSWE